MLMMGQAGGPAGSPFGMPPMHLLRSRPHPRRLPWARPTAATSSRMAAPAAAQAPQGPRVKGTMVGIAPPVPRLPGLVPPIRLQRLRRPTLGPNAARRHHGGTRSWRPFPGWTVWSTELRGSGFWCSGGCRLWQFTVSATGLGRSPRAAGLWGTGRRFCGNAPGDYGQAAPQQGYAPAPQLGGHGPGRTAAASRPTRWPRRDRWACAGSKAEVEPWARFEILSLSSS